jgi:oxygen-independent coproporphyrinogen-3 oxidase
MLRDGGISDISIDLIFALPAGVPRDWTRDLALALALSPTHVSLYGLTVETHTPLGRWRERGEVEEAPEERYESDYLTADRMLTAAGLEHYEVSNFGLPGHRARHNSAYWSGVPYAGIGPAAHEYDGVSRRWNVAPYAEWVRLLTLGYDPAGGSETLTEENRATERVYLGLRTTDGLALAGVEVARVQPWVEAGWGDVSNGVFRASPLGWLRLDSLASDLTVVRSR